jgi:MFS family permease
LESMRLPSRRSLVEARIRLGSLDRFLLLYGTMFAAFGVVSPFVPALLHARGLGPSEIGAVLTAGTAIRLITGPVIARFADRLGKHQQILVVLLAMAAVIAFGYDLPAGFAIFLIVSVWGTFRRWRPSCRFPPRSPTYYLAITNN